MRRLSGSLSRFAFGGEGENASEGDLDGFVVEALKGLGGSGEIVAICKSVWNDHEQELRDAGDLFYTWQYDIRWSAKRLRDQKVMKAAEVSPKGIWELA